MPGSHVVLSSGWKVWGLLVQASPRAKLLQGEKEAFLQVVSAFFNLLETLEKNSKSPPSAPCNLHSLILLNKSLRMLRYP